MSGPVRTRVPPAAARRAWEAGGVESVSSVEIGLPAAVVFDRVTALRNHERLIPLTTIDTPNRRPRVGDVTTATSVAVLVDTMELTRYAPPTETGPGRAVWTKLGPVLLGDAEIVVAPLGPGRCRIDWIERDIHLRGLPPSWTTALLTTAVGVMTRVALARFVRLSAPRT